MAASLSELKEQIEAAERAVHAADGWAQHRHHPPPDPQRPLVGHLELHVQDGVPELGGHRGPRWSRTGETAGHGAPEHHAAAHQEGTGQEAASRAEREGHGQVQG